MDAGSSKNDVQRKESSDSTDLKHCFGTQNGNQKLLQTVRSLVSKIENLAAEPQQFAEIYTLIESIVSSLNVHPPPSPLLDQLLGELQKLRSPSAGDQWKRLAGIEENLVHVVANVGYDILNAVQEVYAKVASLAEAHSADELPHTFALDPHYSKQRSIIKYMQFLQQIPRCEGQCLCSSESTLAPARCHTDQLDRRIHWASPVPLYEVCPIEVIFKSFESENTVSVVINFAAAASYTNFVSSIFIPNRSGPVAVQIPWMSMPDVQVLGKVTAEIQFSTASVPVTFPMNVIDWEDHGNRVVILGRDFVDKHVQSVYHDSNVVVLKDRLETPFDKRFVYVASVLRDVETTFCRYRLKNKVKDVDDVQAKIDRLQRVLVQHTSEKKEPKSDEQNAESSHQAVEIPVSISQPKVTKDSRTQVSSQHMISEDVSLPDRKAEADVQSEKQEDIDAKDGPKMSSKSAQKETEIVSSLFEENPSSSHVVEKVSNTGPMKSSENESKEVTSEPEKAEKASENIDSLKVEWIRGCPVVKLPESEKQPVEFESIQVESNNRIIGSVLVAKSAQYRSYKMKCPQLDEREPSYFHQLSEEVTWNPKVDDAEKVVLDPTRTRPPGANPKLENAEKVALDATRTRPAAVHQKVEHAKKVVLDPTRTRPPGANPKVENAEKVALEPTRPRPPVANPKVETAEKVEKVTLDPTRTRPPGANPKVENAEKAVLDSTRTRPQVVHPKVENAEKAALDPTRPRPPGANPKVESAEKAALDPTRTRPPVVQPKAESAEKAALDPTRTRPPVVQPKVESAEKATLDPTRTRPPVGQPKVESAEKAALDPRTRLPVANPKVENAEKAALDPTRTRPPVVKKESSVTTEDSLSESGKNKDKNQKPDLPARSAEKVDIESGLQSGSEVRYKPVSQPQKPPVGPVLQNVDQTETAKQLLMPASVMKKHVLEDQSADSCAKDLAKSVNLESSDLQEMDWSPDGPV